MAIANNTPKWSHIDIISISRSSHNEVHLRRAAAEEAAFSPNRPDQLRVIGDGNSMELSSRKRNSVPEDASKELDVTAALPNDSQRTVENRSSVEGDERSPLPDYVMDRTANYEYERKTSSLIIEFDGTITRLKPTHEDQWRTSPGPV